MRRSAPLLLVLLALGLTACGGDDETATTTGASGITGAQEPATDAEITAGDFMDASIPDQIQAVQEAAEANPECADADTAAGSDFQVGVAIDAASVDPQTPLAEIVADNC
jgi:ABC-type glycerol-3-phosphate transport system substrate-binding protein